MSGANGQSGSAPYRKYSAGLPSAGQFLPHLADEAWALANIHAQLYSSWEEMATAQKHTLSELLIQLIFDQRV